ncbi:hypothetical protein CRUP_032607 [Coryphaenoides rupestris]|nr:hypothetical protein CRUP_032607 [Coryphaenoides rupestris]
MDVLGVPGVSRLYWLSEANADHRESDSAAHEVQEAAPPAHSSSLLLLLLLMATMVANRGLDAGGAARTHSAAVTRNYISQPRLSTY